MTDNTAVAPTPDAVRVTTSAPLARRKVAAGFFMIAGVGWNAGLEARPFHPVVEGVSALAVHLLPLAALVIVLMRAQRQGLSRAGKGRGASVAAAMALAFGAFSVLFSVTHPDAAMGIHNVNDVLPIAILDAGALLWLVPGRRVPAAGPTR